MSKKIIQFSKFFALYFLAATLSSCLTAKNFNAAIYLRSNPIKEKQKWFEYKLTSINSATPYFRVKGMPQSFVKIEPNGTCYKGVEPNSEEDQFWTVFDLVAEKMWVVVQTRIDCEKTETLTGDLKFIIKMPMKTPGPKFVYAVATLDEDILHRWAENLSDAKKKQFGLEEYKKSDGKGWSFSNLEGTRAAVVQNMSAIKPYETAYSPIEASKE